MSGQDILLAGVVLIALFATTYFFTIRPQKKQMKEFQYLIENLEKGDQVMTAGGLVGRIYSIKGEYLILELAPDQVKVKIRKESIIENFTDEEDELE